MNLIEDWDKIRTHFNTCFKSNFHVSVAAVDKNNNPTVTPIGTLFLNDNQTGFYFEKFPVTLPKLAESNSQICILAVNSNKFFWIKSLFFSKFANFPAIRLIGHLGEQKKASPKELARLNRRMKLTRRLKGNIYLWGDMNTIRVIHFKRAESIKLGKMTHHLI